MNAKMLYVVLFVVAFFASTTTFAGDKYEKPKPTATAEANAKADAKALAIAGGATVKNNIVIKNIVGGGDVTATGGAVNIAEGAISATGGRADANVTIEDGAIRTGDVNVKTGDVTLETGDVSLETGDVNLETGDILIEAQEVLPGVLHVGTPYLPEPQLFNESVDAAEGGIRLAEWFNRECALQYTREKPLKPMDGKVGGTRIVFAPHQNLSAEARKSETDKIRFLLPKDPQKCLGIVTAESESKKINPLGAIQADVAKYVLRYVKGVGEINLVAMPDSVTANRSVTTGGRGLNLLTSISKALSSERAVAGLGGGGAITGGKSFTRALLGNTWMVMTPDPGGVPIDFKSEQISEITEEVSKLPQTKEVAKAPEPASPLVVVTIILDRDPNDFGSRQIKYKYAKH